jgi:hypothetical protein
LIYLLSQGLDLFSILFLIGPLKLAAEIENLAIGLVFALSLAMVPTTFRASSFNLATFCC